MNPTLDKEKLTAYVLGELDENETERVVGIIQESRALRLQADELMKTASLAQEVYAAEPALVLQESRRDSILQRAGKKPAREIQQVARRRVWTTHPMFKLAASLLVVVAMAAVLLPALSRAREAAKRSSPANFRKQIDLMRRMAADDATFTRTDAEGMRAEARQLGMEGEFNQFVYSLPSSPAPHSVGKQLNSLGYLGDGRQVGRSEGPSELRAGVAYVAEELKTETQSAAAAATPEAVLPSSQIDHYLIKNAQMTIETKDPGAAGEKITQAVANEGGYVSSLRESVDTLGHKALDLELRVPAQHLAKTLLQFEPLGKVLYRQITTEDVTEEHIDTDSRMRNMKKTEERLLDHLNRMATLEDILKAEQELGHVREKIEQMEGRLRFLDHRVAFSTIRLTLVETPAAEPMAPPQTFSTARVFSQAIRTLLEALQSLWTMLIWLIIFGPLCLPPAVIAFWVLRRCVKVFPKIS
ncbi:MAG: DUF4349 domain-containing protein [Candidatus Hydrogenedentes bacterium]|nr:DUF4349 domain-containing protein [Candidatus Hydrogenedentota bacterium]